MKNMNTSVKENLSLKELTETFLVHFLKNSRAKFKIIKNAKRIAQNGDPHELDFLIIDELINEEIGVKCKDWDRSISVTVVNSFINEIKELGLSSGLLIGARFSESAKMRAEDTAIINLIARGRMNTWLIQHGIKVDS